MKNRYLVIFVAAIISLATACNDKWDDHYSAQDIVVDNSMITIADGNIQDYIKSDGDFSILSGFFNDNSIYSLLDAKDQNFTVLAYDNSSLDGVTIDDKEFFSKTCVCDLELTPTKLTNGYSVKMWSEKYLAVYIKSVDSGNEIYIAGSKLKEIVKASNGYIYVMESPIFAPKSLYYYLGDLDDNKYSMFKNLVFSFEEKVFDRDNSTPIGVDVTGNTIYDSVFVSKNTLMDRYNSAGAETWNMRSEFYSSTMLIYSNDLITTALNNAYDYVREALNREPNEADILKFKQWIVKSAFYSSELTAADLDGETDITSVSGYLDGASASTAGIQWKPTVQKVDTSKPVELSNGIAYFVTEFKIPNNVVVYRIKNRFYLWDYCNEAQKAEYFVWNNLESFAINDKGTFGPIGPWPIIYYKALAATPTADAYANKSVVSVECTGISLNENGEVSVAMIPPGEYYLRMGFIEKMPYTVNVYVNDVEVARNLTITKAHFDRAGTGYPEWFVPAEWTSTNSKAANYDRDGWEVGTVTITGEELQPIKIKIESTNLTANSTAKLNIYHWCLHPTENNY